MRRVFACLLALLLATTAMALAEETPIYQSEHGYSIGLPDESWFRLDGDAYAQYEGALGEAFAGAGVGDAEEAERFAEIGLEYFFSPEAPGSSLVVQCQQVPISDEDLRLTLDGLRQVYEGMLGAEGYVDGTLFTFGETDYEGCQYTLEGQRVTQLYVRPENASYILTFKGFDDGAIAQVLAPATFT